MGILQIGSILWTRVQLQSAAQAAARAYTVWQPEDRGTGLSRARRAAALALRPTNHRGPVLVSLDELGAISADFSADHGRTWLSGGLGHRLDVSIRQRAPWGLRWLWPDGLKLSAKALVLSEESKERDASED